MSYKHNLWQVFSDFVEVSAIALSNGIDPTHREEREQRYMEIIKGYDKGEPNMLAEAFASMVDDLEQSSQFGGYRDVLGELFHELELHNKYKGQFFTPISICELMAEVTVPNCHEAIAGKGYISVNEPCVGSGAMVLGMAKSINKQGFDFRNQMVVTAVDIDLKCVCMCYVQLSLYGIPAVVIHGNTLTVEEWSRWYTPAYVLNGWIWREPCGITKSRNKYDELLKMSLEPTYGAIRKLFGYGETKNVKAENENTEKDFDKNIEKEFENVESFEVNILEKNESQIISDAVIEEKEITEMEYAVLNNGQLSLF